MRHSVLKPAGHVFITDPSGGVHSGDTVQCVHCAKHWQFKPGSGKTRGFCARCNGITCGSTACDTCVPAEQRLDNAEAGRPRLWVPTRTGFEQVASDKDMRVGGGGGGDAR